MREVNTKWVAIVLSAVVLCGMLIACGEKPNPDQPEPEQPPQEDLDPSVEELYKSVLDTYYEVGRLQDNEPEKWAAVHGETPYAELPYVLKTPYWVSEGGKSYLDHIAYAAEDLNGDGVEELLLGWTGTGAWDLKDGDLFAVYTMHNDEPMLAVEGWERSTYRLLEDGRLYHHGSNSAFEFIDEVGRFPVAYRMKDNGRTIEIFFEEAVGAGWNEAGDDIRYAYSDDPEEIQEYEIENIFTQTLGRDEASKIVDGWYAMGKALEVTPLSKYQPVTSTK